MLGLLVVVVALPTVPMEEGRGVALLFLFINYSFIIPIHSPLFLEFNAAAVVVVEEESL